MCKLQRGCLFPSSSLGNGESHESLRVQGESGKKMVMFSQEPRGLCRLHACLNSGWSVPLQGSGDMTVLSHSLGSYCCLRAMCHDPQVPLEDWYASISTWAMGTGTEWSVFSEVQGMGTSVFVELQKDQWYKVDIVKPGSSYCGFLVLGLVAVSKQNTHSHHLVIFKESMLSCSVFFFFLV